MDIGGLQSNYNGHTVMEGWHNESSAGFLAPKRKRAEFTNTNGDRAACFTTKETTKKHSSFVRIDGQRNVYYSECWKPNRCTLYLPMCGPVLANLHKYEQISFEQGPFCIGDETGRFQQRVEGQALHCWRYNKQEKKLFIALSYLFTNFEVFQEVLNSFEDL